MNKNLNSNKIAVIGAGGVGATTAYALMVQGVGSEIVLIDLDQDKAEGEAMDLRHGASFVNPVNIYSGDYKDLKDAKLIIITAGAAQKTGETRLDLIKKNTGIFKNIISSITEYNQDGILLVVTNPVDILTYLTYKLSGFPANRVIGSGTMLDSSRFRSLLSKKCGVAAANIHGYIIGEHGDSEVPVWSLTNIAGTPIEKYCPICSKDCNEQEHSLEGISKQVKNAAYEIIEKKGATFYAIALAVSRIARAILRDENAVLTVSSLMEGYYGVEDMSLSLPTLINSSGIDRVLELPLSEKEEKAFRDSAGHLKENIRELDI